MFENVTYEDILDRMLGRIDDSYDKRESSPIYAAIAPAALELTNLYAALEDMMDEVYADTASREYLMRIAASRGLKPRSATKAIVLAEFVPDTIEIENDAEFTAGENTYRMIRKKESGVYELECEEAGSVGNLYTGDIIPVDYIEGLESAVIKKILIYGEEEENTEVFRKRYMDSFKANSFGGNQTDYQNKALAVSGVGAVKVTPVWSGPGTVLLTILDLGFRQASAELLEKVQNAFDPDKNGLGDGLAPIGHRVTVDTVEEVLISIASNITYDTGYDWETCQNSIENTVRLYFSELQKEWNEQEGLIVRISSINNAILSVQGVIDVMGTTINSAEGNLVLDKYKIPIFGGINNV